MEMIRLTTYRFAATITIMLAVIVSYLPYLSRRAFT
jgi:hypothetical protein